MIAISLILIIAIPLILIKIFMYCEEDISIKEKITPKRKDIITLIIVSILSWLIQINNLTSWFTILLIAYLIFMSYTDQKTKLLYSMASTVMIALGIVNIITTHSFNSIAALSLIIPTIMLVMSVFRFIGLGDVLIYYVLALYYISISQEAAVLMMINVLITNILFVIVSVVSKNKEKHKPLTIFIAISTFLLNILF